MSKPSAIAIVTNALNVHALPSDDDIEIAFETRGIHPTEAEAESIISRSSDGDGAWVKAWLWVPYSDLRR
jgi:hypothetical protein